MASKMFDNETRVQIQEAMKQERQLMLSLICHSKIGYTKNEQLVAFYHKGLLYKCATVQLTPSKFRRRLKKYVTIPHFSTYHEVTKMGFHKIPSVRLTESFDFFILCTGNFKEILPFSAIKRPNLASDNEKFQFKKK